jgi:hypothetical protein
MGDLANMTDNDGRLNGYRLLKWLRSRAQWEHSLAGDAQSRGQVDLVLVHMHMAVELGCMADDLERELTPPDYPEDDDDGQGDAVLGHLRTCPDCGARHNVRRTVDGCCPACVARRNLAPADDTVDLDDPALKGGPE